MQKVLKKVWTATGQYTVLTGKIAFIAVVQCFRRFRIVSVCVWVGEWVCVFLCMCVCDMHACVCSVVSPLLWQKKCLDATAPWASLRHMALCGVRGKQASPLFPIKAVVLTVQSHKALLLLILPLSLWPWSLSRLGGLVFFWHLVRDKLPQGPTCATLDLNLWPN